VVFDYGQVISLPPDPKELDHISRRVGVEREKFESLFWSLRDKFDRGTITAREYYKDILSHLDVSMDDEGIDEIIAMDLASWRNINPGTACLMEEVKSAGYVLGILSNMPKEFLVWAKENLPVFSLPDTALFSCELNLLKPEEAIYRKLLSTLNLEGKEIVFFDDKPENIEGARALGIEAFLWDSPENARKTLASLEVKL